MTPQLISQLFEHIAQYDILPKGQTWWLDLYKRQFEMIPHLNEQFNFPCALLEYDTDRTLPETNHSFTLYIGFRNELYPRTYLNQVAGNTHIQAQGLEFLTIKEDLKIVLEGFKGSDFYTIINGEKLNPNFPGITVIELRGGIYQTDC